LRDRLGDGGFSCPGWAVDRDDHAKASITSALPCRAEYHRQLVTAGKRRLGTRDFQRRSL
jgi:hypothetical protein